MSPTDEILLDTGVVLHLIRGSPLGRKLVANYDLMSRRYRPLISVVTFGEILSFARRRAWAAPKTRVMYDLLSELVVVDIYRRQVLEKYAEIDAYLESRGKPIGQNDIWIGATAAATGALLLTTDKDFDLLDPQFIKRDWIDQSTQ